MELASDTQAVRWAMKHLLFAASHYAKFHQPELPLADRTSDQQTLEACGAHGSTPSSCIMNPDYFQPSPGKPFHLLGQG
eukprot:1137957-Pelagomonas_calceolata.AAC.2